MKKIILCFVCYLACQNCWSQNVGINNNTPSERLDVNGHINVSADSSYKIGGSYFVKAKLASNNTWLGKLAGMNSSGTQNLYVGDSSGTSNTGNGNVFIGQSAGRNSVSNNSVIIGRSAAPSIITGNDNVYLGNGAAFLSQYGSSNVIIGKNAGYNNMGSTNVYIGYIAGYKNQNGYGNVGLGYAAGHENINGIENTNIGMQTAVSNTNGNYNTYLGFKAGWGQTSGDYNVMLGYQTSAGTSGSTASNKNVLIGAFSKTAGFAAVQRSVAIGYKSTVYISDAVVIGGDSTTAIGIGCSDPQNGLNIDMPVILRGENYIEGSNHAGAFDVADLVTVSPTKPLITIYQPFLSDDRYLDLEDGYYGQEIVIYSVQGIVRIKDLGMALTPGVTSNIKLRSTTTLDLLTGRALKLIFLDNSWREL